MTGVECPREPEVLDAVASARWPHRMPPELADHVASCSICAEVAMVAAAIRDDHDAAWPDVAVPSSGQVWWRAEMRTRQEAIRQASRPIAIAQAVALVFALALAAAASWLAWTSWGRDHLSSLDLASLSGAARTSPLTLPFIVALCALAVITPVALYLVLSDD
jgi:hypothetical protein